MTRKYSNLRVALIAGTLGVGGAEKQLVYIVKSLMQAGVDVRVYTLNKGEFYEAILADLGVKAIMVGHHANPLLRMVNFIIALRRSKPHIIHSIHFYTNLYASVAAYFCGAVDIGSIRSDAFREVASNSIWGKLLLHVPRNLIANSQTGCRNAVMLGVDSKKIYYLPNVIDLSDFDKHNNVKGKENSFLYLSSHIVVAAIGRLIPLKRFDRFIEALSLARRDVKSLTGIIIGDGPERLPLQRLAVKHGLSGEDIIFVGQSDKIPEVLENVNVFMLTSEKEGFPNVLLEAMAARLPVITTPAGESDNVVQHGVTGFIVPFEDVTRMAHYIVELSQSRQERNRLGQAGRQRVEQVYGYDKLSGHLFIIYEKIALQTHSHELIEALGL